jgi:hypothetical protein
VVQYFPPQIRFSPSYLIHQMGNYPNPPRTTTQSLARDRYNALNYIGQTLGMRSGISLEQIDGFADQFRKSMEERDEQVKRQIEADLYQMQLQQQNYVQPPTVPQPVQSQPRKPKQSTPAPAMQPVPEELPHETLDTPPEEAVEQPNE